jgi:hypothetical protein
MNFTYDDGGRSAAGFKGKTDDCVCRALAIATGKPYQEIYDFIKECGGNPRVGGIKTPLLKKICEKLGARYFATAKVGQPSTVKLIETHLPAGRVVVNLRKHVAAVIDGTLRDAYDCQNTSWIDETGVLHEGKRTVYGYWIF